MAKLVKRHFHKFSLNPYRIMWLFVMFDLPTNTKKERRAATKFRKKLLNDGFRMKQYSIYVRHCPNGENADVHTRRVKINLPSDGQVSVMRITDKQYGKMLNFWGKTPQKPAIQAYKQLEMF